MVIAMNQYNLQTYVAYFYGDIGWGCAHRTLIGHFYGNSAYSYSAITDPFSYLNVYQYQSVYYTRFKAIGVNPISGQYQ